MALPVLAQAGARLLPRIGQFLSRPGVVIGGSAAAGYAGSTLADWGGDGGGMRAQDVGGFYTARRNVKVLVNPATGQVIIVPGDRKRRRKGGRRLTQVERDLMRSAADLNRIMGFAMVANTMRSVAG